MGLFKSISDAIAARRSVALGKRKLLEGILGAAKDGTLNEVQISIFQEQIKSLNLSDSDISRVQSPVIQGAFQAVLKKAAFLPEDQTYLDRIRNFLTVPGDKVNQARQGVQMQAYNQAFQVACAKGDFSPEDLAYLDRIEHFLMIPSVSLNKAKWKIYRVRMLAEIEKGVLPTVTVQNVIFQKNEIAHWAEAGSLLEDRVVNRRYEGASRGVSVRVMKGVTYRIGQQRGHLVTDTATVPVSTGSLIITNKRLIFAGDRKSFSLRLNKLLETNCYSNGIGLSDENGKGRLIVFSSPDNAEIVASVLSHAINLFTTP